MTVAGLLLFAALLIAAPRSAAPLLVLAATGIAAGLPAGPIMSLPAALPARVRALGLGLFFTLFYAGVVAAPAAGGALSAAAGAAAAAYGLGASDASGGPCGARRYPAARARARHAWPPSRVHAIGAVRVDRRA